MKPLDVLMGISVPLVWGMGFTFAKPVVADFPPILLMALRFAVTALVLVWFVRPPWPHMRALVLIAFVSAAVQYALTFNGLRFLDASTAILIVQLEVPFATLLAVALLGERLGMQKVLGMVIAFAGVFLIAGEPRPGNSWIGVVLLVGGAFSWALGQIMVKRIGQIGGFVMIAWVAVFATPQLFAASLIFEDNQIEHIANAGALVWLSVLYMGVVMTAVGYAMWYRLIGLYPVGTVAPFLLLLPVFTILASVTLLGEQLTAWLLVGAVLVIAGVAIITVERPRKTG